MNITNLPKETMETIIKSLKETLTTIDKEIEDKVGQRKGILEALSALGSNGEMHLLPYAVLNTNTENVDDHLDTDKLPHHPPADAINNYDKNLSLRLKITMILSALKRPLTTREIFAELIKYEKTLGGKNEGQTIKNISATIINGTKSNHFVKMEDTEGNKKKTQYKLR